MHRNDRLLSLVLICVSFALSAGGETKSTPAPQAARYKEGGKYAAGQPIRLTPKLTLAVAVEKPERWTKYRPVREALGGSLLVVTLRFKGAPEMLMLAISEFGQEDDGRSDVALDLGNGKGVTPFRLSLPGKLLPQARTRDEDVLLHAGNLTPTRDDRYAYFSSETDPVSFLFDIPPASKSSPKTIVVRNLTIGDGEYSFTVSLPK